ncbi:MAG TPA: GIY-YIG nuclease family protein, partial [Pirellulales bacterium]|nr:GIY-YIG nuclease family protein [Pirellulales bacterium]
MSDFYVYVYIYPRNLEEFYYGKGRGSRKGAHLVDKSDSAKSRRIAEIRKEGLAPLIRVIARGLTEAEALLVEKTLLWKLGKLTDLPQNVVPGAMRVGDGEPAASAAAGETLHTHWCSPRQQRP